MEIQRRSRAIETTWELNSRKSRSFTSTLKNFRDNFDTNIWRCEIIIGLLRGHAYYLRFLVINWSSSQILCIGWVLLLQVDVNWNSYVILFHIWTRQFFCGVLFLTNILLCFNVGCCFNEFYNFSGCNHWSKWMPPNLKLIFFFSRRTLSSFHYPMHFLSL